MATIPSLTFPRLGQIPSSKTVIYTPDSAVAVRVTLVNTATSSVRVRLWLRLAAYAESETGERQILDLELGADNERGYTAEKSAIVMQAGDQLLAEAELTNTVDFTISGVTG